MRLGVIIVAAMSIVQIVVELVRGFTTRSWVQADLGTTIREAVDRIPGVRR
ncbi:hypothetical protein ACFQX7_35475 [Luedemannella flava]